MDNFEAYAMIKIEGTWGGKYEATGYTKKQAWKHLLVKLIDLNLDPAQEMKLAVREINPEQKS